VHVGRFSDPDPLHINSERCTFFRRGSAATTRKRAKPRGEVHARLPLAGSDRGGPAVAAALSRAVGKLAAALATEIAAITGAPPA
jgi:hypothetical protein